MNVAVTGGSGFIGSKFIQLYKNKFDSIVELNSKNAPLGDYTKLKELTKDIDILVHTAFDHSYKSNIIGIKNILRVCKENNIKKFIYLSTISVYNPDIKGVLNENLPYSKLNDPYSKEKQKIEKIINGYEKSFDVVILQPSIVYGLGGNWTKYALHVCKSKALSLPDSGENICNAVYVDDVAKAIYQSCINDIKYEKIIISNDEKITWRDFYTKHCEVLTELKLPSNCNILENMSNNEFHSKGVINFIFNLWFKTPLGNLFDLAIGVLKKLRAKSYVTTSTSDELKNFLQSDVRDNILEPLGITKKVHNSKFSIDISKAKKLLQFQPKISFENGMKNIKNDMQKVLSR